MRLSSYEIVENSMLMTRTAPRRRSWRERLFSRPWRPWRKFETVYVPDPNIYKMQLPSAVPGSFGANSMKTIFICHPQTAGALREALEKENDNAPVIH